MIRVRSLACLSPMMGLLAGCAATPLPAGPVAPPVARSPVVAPIPTPAPAPHVETRRCPSAAEIAKLRETRPKPLRDQKMPETTSARVARTAAQLGLYEAKGQWADQVERALRKCDEH